LQLLLHGSALPGGGGQVRGQAHLQPGAVLLELAGTQALGLQRAAQLLELGLTASKALCEGGALGLPFCLGEPGRVLEAPLEEQPRQASPEQATGGQQGEGENEGHGGTRLLSSGNRAWKRLLTRSDGHG